MKKSKALFSKLLNEGLVFVLSVLALIIFCSMAVLPGFPGKDPIPQLDGLPKGYIIERNNHGEYRVIHPRGFECFSIMELKSLEAAVNRAISCEEYYQERCNTSWEKVAIGKQERGNVEKKLGEEK